MSEEVALDKQSEASFIEKIVDRFKGEVKKEREKETKEDQAIGELTDLINQAIEERLNAKLAEGKEEKPVEKTDEKLKGKALEETTISESKEPPEKKPVELGGGKGESLSEDKPPPPPQAQVNKTPAADLNKFDDDLPVEVQEAIDEVAKNPQAGFATIFKYLYDKRKERGDRL